MLDWVIICLLVPAIGGVLWSLRVRKPITPASPKSQTQAQVPPVLEKITSDQSDLGRRVRSLELEQASMHETVHQKLLQIAGRKGGRPKKEEEPAPAPVELSYDQRLRAVRERGNAARE